MCFSRACSVSRVIYLLTMAYVGLLACLWWTFAKFQNEAPSLTRLHVLKEQASSLMNAKNKHKYSEEAN